MYRVSSLTASEIEKSRFEKPSLEFMWDLPHYLEGSPRTASVPPALLMGFQC